MWRQLTRPQFNALIADPNPDVNIVTVNNFSPVGQFFVISIVLATIVLDVFFVRWYMRDS